MKKCSLRPKKSKIDARRIDFNSFFGDEDVVPDEEYDEDRVTSSPKRRKGPDSKKKTAMPQFLEGPFAGHIFMKRKPKYIANDYS
jgi:hypothetical protein